MANFRGVDTEALIDSFVRAQMFLRSLHLGENTEKVLVKWEQNDILNKVRTARDEAQLVTVLRQTEALPLLSLYKDVFVYHAALEEEGGDNGHQVRDLYRDLSAWSAFFDETATVKPALDKEIKCHIVFDTLAHIESADSLNAQCDARLDETVAQIRKKDGKLADWLEGSFPLIRALRTDGEPGELASWLTGSSSTQDNCLQNALYTMCNLKPEESLAGVPKAMEQYRILLSNEKGSPQAMPSGQWSQHLQSVKVKLQLAMAPFAKKAQAANIELFPVTREKDKWSLSFYGTQAAAQAAAGIVAAFHYDVVDPQGHMVPPSPQKLLPGPPPPPTVN